MKHSNINDEPQKIILHQIIKLVLYHEKFHSIPTVDGRNPAPVDIWFIPLLLGVQPSVWWCGISSIHSID